MFGAAQMGRAFDLGDKAARDVHVAWMKSFDGNRTAAERAASCD
jgi:hypothetical protein